MLKQCVILKHYSADFTHHNDMVYILLGVFALTLAAGGFKSMMKESNINGISAGVFLTACIIFNLVPSVQIKGNISISIGGTLLILSAFAVMFHKNKIGMQFYIFYLSMLLGIMFYLVQKAAVGVEITQPNRGNILLYGLFVLTVTLFSPNSKAAYSISVLSMSFSALLFYLQSKTPYVIGGGDTFQIASVLLTVSTVFSYYIHKSVQKLYPKPKAMMTEMSEIAEEISPDKE